MNDLQLTTGLESIAALMVLSILVFHFIPSYRLDSFRQRMFSVRDEMWDYAAAGNISFDDPAYLLLRKLMNGLIRYGHQLTIFRAMMTTLKWHLFGHAPELNWQKKWGIALAGITDPLVREQLESFHYRAISIAMKRLIGGSPLLLLLLLVVSVWKAIEYGWTNLRQTLRNSAVLTLTWIIDPALIEESAARAGAHAHIRPAV
jgi:hypothetical protein